MKTLEKVQCFDGNINYEAYKLFDDINGWGYTAYMPTRGDDKCACLFMVNQSNRVTSFINLTPDDNNTILSFISWNYENVPDWNSMDSLPF